MKKCSFKPCKTIFSGGFKSFKSSSTMFLEHLSLASTSSRGTPCFWLAGDLAGRATGRSGEGSQRKTVEKKSLEDQKARIFNIHKKILLMTKQF